MKNFRKMGLAALMAAVFLVSGCAHTRTQAKDHLARARSHLDIIVHMELPEMYADDFKIAQNAFDQAAEHFTNGRNSAAYKAAEESVKASERILNDFYLNHIAQLARDLRDELRRETRDDPENPLKAHIPTVEGVMEKAEAAQSGAPVSLNAIMEDLEAIMRITYSIRTTMNRVLESDVSFKKGQYQLSEKGVEAIDGILGAVVQDKTAYLKNFPTKTITTHVKVVGYTDSLNFARGTPLMEALTLGAEDQVPKQDPERRRFLNQRLSEFRASNIADHIASILNNGTKTDRFKVETEFVGKGEQAPPGVQPPYPVMDERRRVCKIYIYTTTD